MMSRWQFVRRLAPLITLMVMVLAGCGRADMSALNPQGPVAQQQFDLMKLSITIMMIVVVVVFVIAIYVIIRFRRKKGDDSIPEQVEGSHKLEMIWTTIPIILLVILAVPTMKVLFELSEDYREDPNALKVVVTSHLFWWEFEYPEYGITTATELVIPTDRTIAIETKSADVKHSFWIPALAGKIDSNAGDNVNHMFFSAPKEGVYFGKCAELCGQSHGLMEFKVKAVDEASFDRWVTAIQAPVSLPSDKALADTFEAQCLSCHAVGSYGGPAFPNLTGIGSRDTVAGWLVNTDDPKYSNEGSTYDNLYRWIKDPEKVKPGNQMSGYTLTDEEIAGIAKYLSELTLEY